MSMDNKFADLTICEPFMLSKMMQNERLARRLMEKLTGNTIYKVSCNQKYFITHARGCDGIVVELHLANLEQSVWRTELYITNRDVFGKGRPIYHFTERCREFPLLQLEEGMHRIFVCATEETVAMAKNEELKAILYYVLNADDRRSNLAKMLADELGRIKRNPTNAKLYRLMKWEETEAEQVAYAMRQKDRR